MGYFEENAVELTCFGVIYYVTTHPQRDCSYDDRHVNISTLLSDFGDKECCTVGMVLLM